MRTPNVSLRLAPEVTARAESLARALSSSFHAVTTSEVLRQAVVVGLDLLTKETERK